MSKRKATVSKSPLRANPFPRKGLPPIHNNRLLFHLRKKWRRASPVALEQHLCCVLVHCVDLLFIQQPGAVMTRSVKSKAKPSRKPAKKVSAKPKKIIGICTVEGKITHFFRDLKK